MGGQPYLRHPLTGAPLVPLGMSRRGPIWPILGAAGDGDGGDGNNDQGGDAGSSGDGGGGSDKGFPADTPVAEMTDAQQAAYWKHQSRKHENTAKARADYDALKARAAKADELEAATATETDKAIKAARDEAAAETLRAAAPRLVRAEFRAAAKGVLSDEQRDALLEDLDLTKYLTDKGEVDEDKVARKVTAFAPAGNNGGSGGRPDMGQGRRAGATQSKASAGKAEAARRFGEKTTAATQ
jgi:hypothetical protein